MDEIDNTAFDELDTRDRVVQRMTEEYNGVRNPWHIVIKPGPAKQAWTDVSAAAGLDSAKCTYCRHGHCRICEDCSVSKQYSDYWICHHCGELNRRVSNLCSSEVSHGLGKD